MAKIVNAENWIWQTDLMGYPDDDFNHDLMPANFAEFCVEQGPMLFDSQQSFFGYSALINDTPYHVMELRWEHYLENCYQKQPDGTCYGICKATNKPCEIVNHIDLTDEDTGCRSIEIITALIYACVGELLVGLKNYDQILIYIVEDLEDYPWSCIDIAIPFSLIRGLKMKNWIDLSRFYTSKFPCEYDPASDEKYVRAMEYACKCLRNGGMFYGPEKEMLLDCN